jgi:Ca2+-binding RTX toxin-like protein
MLSRICRRAAIAAVSLVLAAGAASPASAGPIGISGTTLIVSGSSAGDVIVGFTVGTELTLSGGTFDIQTSACVGVGVVTCSLAAFDQLAVIAGDGDDVIEMSGIGAILPVFLSGGDGADVLIGGDGEDILKGGPGDDVLLGGPGTNLLFGGPGDDIMVDGVASEADGPADPTLPTAVPEPGAGFLLGLGFAAVCARTRRRR